jgi:DNA-directed RNA polymerase subunit beta'
MVLFLLEKSRGNREIIIESKFGDVRKYLVKLSSQILVQENDFVELVYLSDGAITQMIS